MKNIFSKSFRKMIEFNEASKCELQVGCDKNKIILLKEQMVSELKVMPPEGYLDFLIEMDGYSDFGLMLYASYPFYFRDSDSWIYGVIEMNKTYFRFFPEILVVGQCDDDFLIYDNVQKVYKNMDQFGGNINGEFESFWELVEDVAQYLVDDGGEEKDD